MYPSCTADEPWETGNRRKPENLKKFKFCKMRDGASLIGWIEYQHGPPRFGIRLHQTDLRP